MKVVSEESSRWTDVESPVNTAGISAELVEHVRAFDDPLWAKIYEASCVDSGIELSSEGARVFNDAVRAQNHRHEEVSFRCLSLGCAAMICLAQLKDRLVTRLDLRDNLLGDLAMTPLKEVILSLPKLRWLGQTL
mmetsp:Transcript_33085/g.88664  ORF Transcript_33085/g.88664 Transcript_33085/m.88664 type:complete len:135 (-) Transcript_33085:10-414(-)